MIRDGEWVWGEEIGTYQTGHIVQLTSQSRPRRKHPLGFAPPKGKQRRPRGARIPGTFPDVPRFDVQ